MTALVAGLAFGAVIAAAGMYLMFVAPLADLLDLERDRTTKYRRAAHKADRWTRLWPRTAAKDW